MRNKTRVVVKTGQWVLEPWWLPSWKYQTDDRRTQITHTCHVFMMLCRYKFALTHKMNPHLPNRFCWQNRRIPRYEKNCICFENFAQYQCIRLCNICAHVSAHYAKLRAQIPVYAFEFESIKFHWTDRSVSNCDNLLNVISAMHSFAITEYNLSLLTLKKIIII